MSDEEIVPLRLAYGRDGCFQAETLERQLLLYHHAPQPLSDPECIAQALASPLDFPEVSRAIAPGDHVAVVIDVDTPSADQIFLALWQQLEAVGGQPGDLTLIQPAVWKSVQGVDPRAALPAGLRDQFQLVRHDPTEEGSCAYLASTAGNERVYLSRVLTDADVVVTIGPAEFDSVLGVRGTASSLFPGLSDLESLQRVKGQGHEELSPDDPRPLRQIVDEIGWLLGLQFSIAVIPSGGTTAHEVIAGQCDRVLRRARRQLKSKWRIHSDERAELVLVSVPEDAAGHHWDQVAAAIDAGRRLVERNGRIVVLSQLAASIGSGMEILKSVREPRDAIKQIQRSRPPDLLAATRLALATDWANVSLLSRLDPGDVSDLFMLPLENEREVQRLLDAEDLTAIIEAAQHAFVESGT